MGVMLSVLLSYMGAIELVFIVRDLTHQLALHQMRSKNEQRKQSDISTLQDKIKASINALETVETESVEQMQDGVLYENGYRIEKEQSVEVVAQQWDERRKLMCISDHPSTSESPSKSNISNGCTENGIQTKRTKNTNLNEYERTTENDDPSNDSNDPNNYRPIVRDDRAARSKAFKKRNSSSSQSSDSIRLSREEELKMFTSLEEEECNGTAFTPISYSNVKSNNSQHVDPSFHEKRKYDENPWGNVRPNTFHDSELWKRERATSIEEEREENSSTTPNQKLKKTGATGTADKPTRKTLCENTQDQYASELDACEQLDHIDSIGTYPLTQNGKSVSTVSTEHDLQTMESNDVINRIDKSPDSNTIDPIAVIDIYVNTFEGDLDPADLRDDRSTTVYSRSGSENSNIFLKSISRDSSSCTESNMEIDDLRQSCNRTDSSNSFIQDEIDSEEYHHNHRFSVTAETLEYIRGRDDWRVHTENKLNNLYRRQSSNISIREEIDSDEYHHDRVLSDLIEIAYLDADNIKSLPSSFEDNKVFDRYYLELQQIEGQLSSDIEKNIAQKQVVLLDSNEMQTAEGYQYPLPDIILDRADDHSNDLYTVEQIDSDYSNTISECEDDVQSVIEVNHDGEIITTLDMSNDNDEMIEVTLWDLKDDESNARSSRESSIEIITFANESIVVNDYLENSGQATLLSLDYQDKKQTASEATQTNDMFDDSKIFNEKSIGNNLDTSVATHDLQENIELVEINQTKNISNMPDNVEILTKDACSNVDFNSSNESEAIDTLTTKNETSCNVTVNKADCASNHQDVTITNETNPVCSTEKDRLKSESMLKNDKNEVVLLTANRSVNDSVSKNEISNSFIQQEKLSTSSSATGSESTNQLNDSTAETSKPFNKSDKKRKRSSYENVDDLVKEGCMGIWFHK